MRCLICGDTDAELDEEVGAGAAVCVVCYASIAGYGDAERAELIDGLRGMLPGVQSRMVEGV